MKIEHLAIWTEDLEGMKVFYVKYFHAIAGEKYHNPKKNFESYFLTLGDGARLELMRKSQINPSGKGVYQEFTGLAHFALAVGSREKVNSITDQLRKDGFEIIGDPRTTGDGYYESVVLDPEGNRIEITV
jgi:lactoylglutathione lyase